MATQFAIGLAALENPVDPQGDFDDDHEEGEISDDDDDVFVATAAAERIESSAAVSTSGNGSIRSPRTQHHVNSGRRDSESKHDNSIQTVVKLVNNVSVGNACKSPNDACAQLHDALQILEELDQPSNCELVQSLVLKILDKIRIVYCVYNAIGDEQKPGVLQSLAKLAKFYTDKLFTAKQVEELKGLYEAVNPKLETSSDGKEHAYIPWDGGTSGEHPTSSSLTSYTHYMSASFPMDALPPSPTPSKEDEAARYGKTLTDKTETDSQPVLKPRDPRRGALEGNPSRKREALKPDSQASKRQKLQSEAAPRSGGWLEPEAKDGKSILMKPRDPRRALSETTNQEEQHITSLENGTVRPPKPPELRNQVKDTVEVLPPSNIPGLFPSIPGLEAGSPPVLQNGTELDIHPELQEFLIDLDEAERIAFIKERQRRMDEQDKMLSEKKLCLVLDLDHTLLNSAKFMEIEQEWDRFLRATETIERNKDAKEGTRRELYRFPYMSMWTKLRPGIWRFLARASQLYELHLYTMGNKAYATEMAKLLDPTGVLFAGRVISKGDDGDALYGDEKTPRSKDLDGVLGMESAVLIIDDSARVWPHHKDNLIVVERYMYFPCSRKQFGLPGPSLLEVGHDEREADGMLASILGVVERVHEEFYSRPLPKEVDIREVLSVVQRRILGGCKIIFSRVFPVEETQPQLHPLWRMAEQFGAVCTTRMEEDVTHVVAISMGTDKSNWALATGRFLVRPAWVEASTVLYRRANERDFPVPP
ncbi:hypothetical protein SELMODRAFT_440109 [Selaginella moellendorffii]|uniref:RNA polymerase II C-terminal domain phosphatase-like n=1 Tax=Selaginella moellendorffii TaxID=88036 RepID=D8RA55_SELML|nr:RNA polymerase II C-terminal domain phosphatase-like 3 [Selaginella moellendorffii]EFJ31009.1 hypothetical protein SELMODRAFT_440109 [Selaginella moellendorffii]|eukprot:XP_002967662.1 RNA polymerase II C-terminal domain phosphatase-like 3 [Selaginella moellendorffii]